MPDFKIANAVVHFDEASPHMHVVGVPVGRGFKRGLETKVSKRSVFTPRTLETILQSHLRETAETQMLLHYGVSIKEKQKGQNHDLTVTEYKVKQETKRLWQLEEFLDEREDKLYDTSVRLDQTEREVSEMEKLLIDTKTELAGAEKELVQIKEESRETKQKLAEELQSFSGRYDRMRDSFDRIQERKEGLLADIHVLDGEIDKRIDFINVLDRLREIIDKLLSMIPVVREFVRFVEDKRDIKAASPYGYTPLGSLLRQYRTPLYDRFVIFPEVSSWQTSKGEVIPVYEDFNRRGTSYTLAGFWNVQTDSGIKISEIKDEIIPENRICTLEQAEVYVKAVESFMEEMKPSENAKYDHSMHRSYSAEYERDR